MSGLRIALKVFTPSPLGERVGVRGKNASMIYPMSSTPHPNPPPQGGRGLF